MFFYITPEIIPTDNVYHSIIEGLVIGLSSTGSIEMITKIKDLMKIKKEKSNSLAKETQDSVNNTKNETPDSVDSSENEIQDLVDIK